MLTIRCDAAVCRIEGGPVDPGLSLAVWNACAYQVLGAEHTKLYKQGRWDGFRRLYHRSHRTFPTGLLARVQAVLDDASAPYEVDLEHAGANHPVRLRQIGDEWALRPYQQDAVRAVLDAGRCMVRIATGGGKTVVAGHIIEQTHQRTVFLVHTKDLLYQAKETFVSMFGEEVVGQIGDGVVQPNLITVCTTQTASRALGVEFGTYEYGEDEAWSDDGTLTLSNRAEIQNALAYAGLVIMDECHRVAAPTAMDVLASIPDACYRVGLSASPWRDDGADLALEGAFGSVAVNLGASELIRMGYLVRPVIRFLSVPSMSFKKGTRYESIYRDYIVQNPVRNALGCRAAAQLVKRGKPTLVLTQQVNHGAVAADTLADFLGEPVPFLSGRDASTHRLNVLRDLREGRLRALVATTIADEGLDIKPLAGLVLLGGGKSSVRALQRVGRVLRTFPGKDGATVIDFEDNARYLWDHSHRRAEMYATEPEFLVTDV